MDTCPGGCNINERRSPSFEHSLSVVMVAFWRMECLPGWESGVAIAVDVWMDALVRDAAGSERVRYLICLEVTSAGTNYIVQSIPTHEGTSISSCRQNIK